MADDNGTLASEALDLRATITRIEQALNRMPFGGNAYHGIGRLLTGGHPSPLERLQLIERKVGALADYLGPVGDRINAIESEELRHRNTLSELRTLLDEVSEWTDDQTDIAVHAIRATYLFDGWPTLLREQGEAEAERIAGTLIKLGQPHPKDAYDEEETPDGTPTDA